MYTVISLTIKQRIDYLSSCLCNNSYTQSTFKCKSWPWETTCSISQFITVYNSTINIANLKTIISNSSFQAYEQVHMHIQRMHKTIDSKHTEVATLCPSCLSLLAVPLSLQKVVYSTCYRHSKGKCG